MAPRRWVAATLDGVIGDYDTEAEALGGVARAFGAGLTVRRPHAGLVEARSGADPYTERLRTAYVMRREWAAAEGFGGQLDRYLAGRGAGVPG